MYLDLNGIYHPSLGFQVVIKEAKQEDKTAQSVLVFEEVEEMKSGNLTLVVVKLEAHAIVNLVVIESDVVLVDVVPLLDPNLVGPCTSLSRHKLLQVTYGVILVALHTNLLPNRSFSTTSIIFTLHKSTTPALVTHTNFGEND
ncbi:hypothetical protein SO802_030471 [Lithocarpus litseifolius]|uniref:Uncharacterized protein n=1 Tax=Lithocarpus litseifolius TaxID=425828 RepID=A0AAW2BHM4_9ROSI